MKRVHLLAIFLVGFVSGILFSLYMLAVNSLMTMIPFGQSNKTINSSMMMIPFGQWDKDKAINSKVMMIPFGHLNEAVDMSQDYARCIADGTPLILMFDNRVNDNFNPEKETENLVMLSATLNRLYALRHGYCFKLMKSGPCPHAKYGHRNPKWCKLLGIASALEDGFATVMIFDSDAYINKMSISIPMFLAAMQNESLRSPSELGFAWSPPSDDELASRLQNQTDDFVYNATLVLTADWGRGSHSNTGVMIFRNNDVARRMLRAWWDVNDHNDAIDNEQFAFREYIYNKSEWARHVARLPVNSMNYNGWLVRHFASDRRTRQLPEMTKKVVATLIEVVHSGNRVFHEFNCTRYENESIYFNS